MEAEAGRVEAIRGREDILVYQADATRDLVVRGERWFVRKGKRERQTFEVRAEAAVVFLAPLDSGLPQSGRLPVWGLYAEGFVRVEVASDELGRHVLEAEEAFLDFRHERARLRHAALRASGAGAASGPLGAKRLLIQAQELRVQGAEGIEATGATLTVCRYTFPLWSLGADRLSIRGSDPPQEAPACFGQFGGPVGALAERWAPQGRLLGSITGGPSFQARSWTPVLSGSDGLLRARSRAFQLSAEGVRLRTLPPGLGLGTEPFVSPPLPLLGWDTDWPLPQLRFGSSSRLGTFVSAKLQRELARLRHASFGELRVEGEAGVDYFERRGTAGSGGLSWTRRGQLPGGRSEGEGYLRGYGINDRADQDRVGTAIRNEGRFWLRGLLHERREQGEARVVLDAEASRVSDPGALLEFFRSAAQTEKEQETYAYLRGSYDDLGARLLGRARINDWQSQVESAPEGRLDWITHPLVVEPTIGGLYLDLALRGGHLRFRPSNASGAASYQAWRGDFQGTIQGKTSLGPIQLHAYGGARESLWSERAGDDAAVDRFAGVGGWKASTILWRRFATPFGVLRHELIPELGTRHVFGVNRAPSELLRFDEVEELENSDEGFLRLRTRLLGDHEARRRRLVDLSVEAVYLIGDQDRIVRGRDRGPDAFRGRSWLYLRYDLRLDLVSWLSARVRAEQDLNGKGLVDLNASGTFRPAAFLELARGLELDLGYRELRGLTRVQALNWGLRWRLTKHWALGLDQQYDFVSGEFLRHRGRVVRFFQGFALELSVSHDPQQDDTAVSASIAPNFDEGGATFGADPRYPGS